MKKVIVLLLAITCVATAAMAQSQSKKKVAVYITGEGNASSKKVIGAKLVAAITKADEYAAVERTSDFLRELSKEHDYQRSGNVDDNQIAHLGKQFGVAFVCVAEVSEVYGATFIAARMINVNTGLIIATAERDKEVNGMSDLMEIAEEVAALLLGGSKGGSSMRAAGSRSSGAGLQEGFKVAANAIGKPAADGISGTITGTGSNYYRVRSMGGVWWMIQNADKPVSNGCTYSSISMDSFGRLYSFSCAAQACPDGWFLPTDDDFRELEYWLKEHPDKWGEWNAGSSLAGYGLNGSYYGNQGSGGRWWSSSSSGRYWGVYSGSASGNFNTGGSFYSFSVRCRKSQ
jgi:uncharacterized protein (TIGR02145 family)